jgi:hypothetical protein
MVAGPGRARRKRVRGAAAAAAALLLAAAPALGGEPDPHTLRLKSASFDPLLAVPAPVLPAIEAHPPGVRGGYLVQLDHPIAEADRRALEAAGAAVKGYVPMRALEVVMSEVERERVEALPGVRYVGPVQPGFKLSPALAAELASPRDPSHRLRLQVSLFPGEEEPAAQQLASAGARLLRLEPGRSQGIATVEVPAARLEALARSPLVRFIEESYVRKAHNDRAQFHTGLAAVADDTFSAGLDPSLDGFDQSSGFQVKFGHTDTGLSAAHPDFQNAVQNGWLSFEPGSDSDDRDDGHGTHTAGSVLGDGGEWSTVPAVPPASGSISAGRWRGVTPEAALHHISFENDLSDRQTFERLSEEGVHVSTNSWGYCTPQGPFRCPSITDYNINAAAWDEGVWDADDDVPGLQPLAVFFSAGNDGDGNADGCGATRDDRVGTPGAAKNVITVGANETDRACNAFADHVGDVIDFSSRGPVDPDGTGQGLFKPDVTNVGGDFVLSVEADGVGGAGRDAPSACSDTGPRYRYEGGTSMSAPLTAGLGGLLVQDLVVQRGVPTPAPSLVKALLINGARDLQPSGACDYVFETDTAPIHEGWGLVQALDSLYGPGGSPTRRAVEFESEVSANAVATGETYRRTIVAPAGVPLKVTLVWTDFPAAPGAGSPLVVNDLDLEVVGPEGRFLGNNFAGNWSVEAAVRATPDRYNVVENVYLESPAGGSYDLVVRGFQVSQDQEPDQSGLNQDFSLVWSFPAVPACRDGLDNDGDHLVDLADPVCSGDPSFSRENARCQDGLDNDGDTFVDFDGGLSIHGAALTEPDSYCAERPWRNEEAQARRSSGCGLGFEVVLALLPLRALRARMHGRLPFASPPRR